MLPQSVKRRLHMRGSIVSPVPRPLRPAFHVVFQPTMVQWIELLTKQFNSCQAACEVGYMFTHRLDVQCQLTMSSLQYVSFCVAL